MTDVPRHLGGHANHCWTDRGALEFLMEYAPVKSVLDIGSGTGDQVRVARTLGMTAMGADGDPTHNPDYLVDFTEGVLPVDVPEFDLAWSVEFLEHVPEEFIPYYMDAFCRCRLVVCTASFLDSEKHYNVQHCGYWIRVFESHGFRYSPSLIYFVKRHSTMRPFTGPPSISYIQATGMAFIRQDFAHKWLFEPISRRLDHS